MGFRFRKSINLGGGFRVNLSKSGVGYSWGTKGVRFTKTAKGKKRTTLSVPGTGISYVSEESSRKKTSTSHHKTRNVSSNSIVSTSGNSQNYIEKREPTMAWIDFAICFFFGVLGVHKFREKKIGMGILYLFTCGLFGFGWLYDCVRYLIAAIKSQSNSSANVTPHSTESADTPSMTGPDLPETPKGNNIKKILLWVLTVFLALVAFAYLPAFSGFLALAAAVLVAPIQKCRTFSQSM